MFGQNPLNSAVINTASTGDNIVIAAVTGRRILVWKMNFTVGGATTITAYSDVQATGTALSGAYNLTANGSSLFFPYDSSPYFITAQGKSFNLYSTGTTIQISGAIYYTTV